MQEQTSLKSRLMNIRVYLLFIISFASLLCYIIVVSCQINNNLCQAIISRYYNRLLKEEAIPRGFSNHNSLVMSSVTRMLSSVMRQKSVNNMYTIWQPIRAREWYYKRSGIHFVSRQKFNVTSCYLCNLATIILEITVHRSSFSMP